MSKNLMRAWEHSRMLTAMVERTDPLDITLALRVSQKAPEGKGGEWCT